MSRTLPRRPLGATGLMVSALALGSVKFGRNIAVKYPRAFDLPSEQALRDLLDEATALGINLLDTAPAYGLAEERLGRLLEGRRERWVLCTKAGETFEDGVSRFDFRGDAIRGSVAASLERLRTDHLDCVLIHCDDDDLAVIRHGEALDALAELRAEGRVRSIGVSVKTPEGGLAAVTESDVLMVELSRDRTDMLPVIAAAHRRGCGVLIKKALASGYLGTDAERQLRWAASRPGVSSVVVGTLDGRHLASDAAAVADLEH